MNYQPALGHGSGSNNKAPSDGRAERTVNSDFRYNHPYSERRKSKTTKIGSAINATQRENDSLSLFAGGHSMSGRMFSMVQTNDPIEPV